MSKQVTVTLSDVQVDRINALLSHRRDDTFGSLLIKLMEQGATQLEYHYERNKSQWKVAKQTKVENEQLKAQIDRLMKEKEAREQETDDVVARD